MTSFWDTVIIQIDNALRTVCPPPKRIADRPSPAAGLAEAALTSSEKKHCIGLMRINHAGEVCAQALYQGQAWTAKLTHIKAQMTQAADEEIDHLAWCEERLRELDSCPSRLNVFWYSGSILLGALAGLAGDKISLGFVAETERQVSRHLASHLAALPAQDNKTRVLLQQMQIDEEGHAQQAIAAGGVELPFLIKRLMTLVSKLMTKTSYHF